ncbi:hypothetical protein Tco_0239922, partial [Tanacetum coccineum]
SPDTSLCGVSKAWSLSRKVGMCRDESPDTSLVYVGCQKPGHLAARLGYAETKFATWDDLDFKLIILGWNVKHRILQNVDLWLKFEMAHSPNI